MFPRVGSVKPELQLLLEIARSSQVRPRSTQVARNLHERHGIGQLAGGRVIYGPHDKADAARILRRDHGIDPYAAVLSVDSRTEAAKRGLRNEKVFGGAVRRNRVAIKPITGKPRIGDCEIPRIHGAHIDCSVGDAAALVADHLVVVENYEAFEQLHEINLAMGVDEALGAACAIYRGDASAYRIEWAANLLTSMSTPVVVFGDLDPAGLGHAMRMPRFCGLLAPSTAALRALKADPHTGLSDRYLAQLSQWSAALDGEISSAIRPLWSWLKTTSRAYPQEVFLAQRVEMALWR